MSALGGLSAPASADAGQAGPAVPSAGLPPVVARTITITRPRLGQLTFNALAAGNPAEAQSGRLVLLLHGFPETDQEFREILPEIAAAGYYAVAPSQRGYSPGARPTEISDYEILNMVGDTLAMATALGATSFHLVGHDWGGGVAWATAGLAPSRVSSLAAISTPDPSALDEAYEAPNGVQKAMLGYMKLFALNGSEDFMLALGPGFFADVLTAIGVPYDKAKIYADELGTTEALGAALDWYRANPLPFPTLPPITVPTLYMWGTNDFAFGREAAQDTAKFVSAPYRFVELAGVNHFVPENDPGQVAALLLEQLGGTP